MEDSMAAIKLANQTIQPVFRYTLTLIYALRPQFNNSIKPTLFSGISNQKQNDNDRLLKFSLAVGFISTCGIIGILLMLIFGSTQ